MTIIAPRPFDRRGWTSLIAVTVVAMAARLTAMVVVFDPDQVFAKFFVLADELIASGWVPSEPFAYSPIYILLLAGLVRIGASATVACLVQIGLSVAACVLMWDLTRRLLGDWEGLVAGLWAGVYGPFLLYAISFESDALGWVLLVAATWALVRALPANGVWPLAAAGVLLGLRCIQRPNALLIVPPLLLLVAFHDRRRWSGRLATARTIAFGAATLLPLAPIAALNWHASGELVPVTTHAGWIFYTSSNHAATGLSYATAPLADTLARRPLAPGEPRSQRFDHAISRELACRATGRELSHSSSSRYWLREGWRCIVRRGWRGQLALEGRKLGYMLHAYEGHDNLAIEARARRLGPLLLLGMGSLAPFALVGAVLLASVHRRLWVVLIMLAAPVASMLVFYVAPRFRLELAALVLPFAAAALCRLARAVGSRQAGVVVAIAAAVAVLAVPLNTQWPETRRQERRRTIELHTWRGRTAADPLIALHEYTAAASVALYPTEAGEAYQALATLSRTAGLEARARHYDDVVRGVLAENDLVRLGSRRDDPVARWAIGRHQLVTGDLQNAAATLEAAWRLDPLDPELAFAAARAGLIAGTITPDRAGSWTEQALELGLRFHPEAVDAHLLLARWHLAAQRPHQALEATRAALRLAPENPEARSLAELIEAAARPG